MENAEEVIKQKTEESLAKIGARNAGQVFADTYNSYAKQLPSYLNGLGKKSLIRLLMSFVKVEVKPEDFTGINAEKERVIYGILERVVHAKYGWALFTELANAEDAMLAESEANITKTSEGENVREEETKN